jgi:hypothetical protein
MSSPQKLDPRIVQVGVEVNGQQRIFGTGLLINANGTKFGNDNQNEIEVTITNMRKSDRDYILTETSPFNQNRTRKRVFVYAGRESYGAPLIVVGDITKTNVSQPPDIGVTIKALTGDYLKGKVISTNGKAQSSLRDIATQAADSMGLDLDFQGGDKQVANYSFTGGTLEQTGKLGKAGGVDAFVDDTALVIKPKGQPIAGPVRLLNLDTGLIGQPEYTELGIKVTYLIDNVSRLGAGLRVESILNPAFNGLYVIYKLGFNISSRDTPFYWVAEATRAEHQ